VNAAALADGAAADGAAADGALDAGALGDAVEPLHAAKTTDKVAANTALLTDHLFGEWDMLPISSSGLPADHLPPCPAFGACLDPGRAQGVPAQIVGSLASARSDVTRGAARAIRVLAPAG
jgi:hypothetical protein